MKNLRLVKIAIAVCVVLFLTVSGYSVYRQQNFKASFVKEINTNLTPEERQIYEDRISALEIQLTQDNDLDVEYGILMSLGINQHGLGQLSKAKDTLNKAVQIKQDNYNGYVALSQVQIDMKDYDGAKSSIKEAIRLNNNSANTWKKYIQMEQSHFGANEAKINSLYSEAVVNTNGHIDILTAYASWLGRIGNYQASKEYWQLAIQANPDNTAAYDAEIALLDKKLQEVE